MCVCVCVCVCASVQVCESVCLCVQDLLKVLIVRIIIIIIIIIYRCNTPSLSYVDLLIQRTIYSEHRIHRRLALEISNDLFISFYPLTVCSLSQ